MENINRNMACKPDPPGVDYFEFSRVKSRVESDFSASTMKGDPPSRVKSHFESDFSVSTMTRDPPPCAFPPPNGSKCSQFPENEVGRSPVVRSPGDTSNGPTMTEEHSLSAVSFPYHSFMVKYINEYASTEGFLLRHKCKYYFNREATNELFPGDERYHSLKSNPSQDNRYPRSGVFLCSGKSQGRIKGSECCFHIYYHWDSLKKRFVFSCRSSNLSHNHQLFPQFTVVDGCVIVTMESSLTHDEFLSIKEQSHCRVHVPQMRVNLEEKFPHRSFSAKMLHRMRDKFLKEKYGADCHNITDLFMKGERIRRLGGLFLVVPSSTDFSIETIHSQTKLMGEYARLYGVDGFMMADGTHKITKYDMTFVFWMVIDCLLRSKFVGYTANFTENSNVIIDGANLFFPHEASHSALSADENKILVGGGWDPWLL